MPVCPSAAEIRVAASSLHQRGDRSRLLVLLQSRQVLVGVKMPPDIAKCPCQLALIKSSEELKTRFQLSDFSVCRLHPPHVKISSQRLVTKT